MTNYVVKAHRGSDLRILLCTTDPEQASAFAEGQAIKGGWNKVAVHIGNNPKPCRLSCGEGQGRREFLAEWGR